MEEFLLVGRRARVPVRTPRTDRHWRRDRGTGRVPARLALIELGYGDCEDHELQGVALLVSRRGGAVHPMDDGTEFDGISGDVSLRPSGHDAWVLVGEPAVVIDFQGISDWAKSR